MVALIRRVLPEMPQLFISYSGRSDIEAKEAACLVEELRARGLRTWQDVSDIYDGRKFEPQIREGIYASDGMLGYLSAAALESDYVTKIELPLALDRHGHDSGFAVIPVFRGFDTFETAGQATMSVLGKDLSLFQGHLLPEQPASADLAGIALACLQCFFPRGADSDRSDPLRIGLHTRSYTPGGRDLDVDWTPLLTTPEASPAAWARVQCASNDLKRVLEENSRMRCLSIEGHYHLSAGFLFGYVFRRPSGYRLCVLQDNEVWRQEGSVDQSFSIAVDYGPLAGDTVTVELSAARDVGPAVDAFLAERSLEPRARVRVAPRSPKGFRRVTRGSAWELAHLVAEEAKRVRADLGARRMELFLAGPKALSVLLGAEFNAHGAEELCTFEFTQQGYQLAVAL